jgi:hypothetical protein
MIGVWLLGQEVIGVSVSRGGGGAVIGDYYLKYAHLSPPDE